MRLLIDGKAWLALALLVNGAVGAFSYILPAPLTPLATPELTLGDSSPALPLPDVSGDAALSDLVCRRWGPVGDPSAFVPLMMRVEAAGGTVEIMDAPLAGNPDHLVLIGPAASPTATRRLRDELRSQSIPNQLVNEGRFAGTLSVGAFADLNAAAAFQAELAALGYHVRVETLDSPRRAYNLRAHSPRNAPVFPLPSTACRQG